MPNLSQFYSQFTADLARANRFEVLITPPPALNSFFGNGVAVLAYRCETAQLPGRHLTVSQQKTFGPYEKFPVHTTYNDIDLSFIIDGDMRVREFFDSWLNLINPDNTFNIEYKSNYVTDIFINQYDLQNNLTYQVRLVDAFPMNINQLDLNWGSDAVHKVHVTFAYTYWENTTQSASAPVDVVSSQLNSIAANFTGYE
jgi:hypothetical protein